jgi:hypothetical protein
MQGFGWIPDGKRPHGRPRLDGRLILKWIFKTWDWGGMDWIDVAQ